MKTLENAVWELRIWKDTRGQDFVEYALIAAFIATVYGVITPAAPAVVTVFSKVTSALTKAGG
jgi:Flp pilus assembly pilin Flp